MDSINKRDIHVLKYFSSFVSVSYGKVINITEPTLTFCPLAEHLYKDFSNIRGNDKEAIKNAIKSAIESKIKDYGFFTDDRKLSYGDVSIPYGASEMLMFALRKNAIDAAVVVCEGAGTVITDAPEVVQGIGARMNSLLLTSPIKGIIEKLREHTRRLDFILTDLRLKAYRDDMFDHIYSQHAWKHQKTKYNGMPEICAYQHCWTKLTSSIKQKNIEYYFGGGERGRTKDFIEYVWRPDCTINAKSALLNFDNRIGHSKFLANMQRAKYSIVIADEEYNNTAFVTQRYFENILYDVVSFVDGKYDLKEKLISHTDWRRVHSYKELREKMNYLNTHQKEYVELLKKQRAEITQDMISGQYTYSLIMK